MKSIILSVFILCASELLATAQDDTLYVSDLHTIHIRFDSELEYVNLGDDVLIARIVDADKEFLAVKAKERFDYTTSIFCIETDGDIHSFPVRYSMKLDKQIIDTREHLPGSKPESFIVENGHYETAIFEKFKNGFFSELNKELYHIGCYGYGISITCDNIFYRNDSLYLVMQVTNKSAISYQFSEPRFAVESKKKSKRNLEYEKNIIPHRIYGDGKVQPEESVKIIACFDKITLIKKQVLRIYYYEINGQRNFILTISMNDINKAKRL